MLIPLGFHCNITFLSQELRIKKETGLFEWLESRKLQYITDIVNSIKEKIDTTIIKNVDKYVYVLHEHVFTYHYPVEEYKLIFERRARRFLDRVKNSNELLFVRINCYKAFTTEDEINNFCAAIRSINPDVKITFLLINTVDSYTTCTKLDEKKIHTITFLERFFLYKECVHDKNDEYLHHNYPIRKLFREYLLEAGYFVDEKYLEDFAETTMSYMKDE